MEAEVNGHDELESELGHKSKLQPNQIQYSDTVDPIEERCFFLLVHSEIFPEVTSFKL